MKIFALSILSFFSLTACNSIPKIIQGEFSTVTPVQSKANHVMDKTVRWSGLIVQTINNKDKTCFEVVETETYTDMRPKKTIPKNSSRFLACKEGFLEPHAFNKRLVTITGNLVAYTEQKIGEYNYEYPVVKTDIIYIWRKNPRHNYAHFYNTHIPFYPFARFSCRYSSLSGYCY